MDEFLFLSRYIVNDQVSAEISELNHKPNKNKYLTVWTYHLPQRKENLFIFTIPKIEMDMYRRRNFVKIYIFLPSSHQQKS